MTLAELNIALSEVSDATVLLDDRVVIPAVEMACEAWYTLTDDPRWPILCSIEDGPVAKFASIRAAARWEDSEYAYDGTEPDYIIEGVDWVPV